MAPSASWRRLASWAGAGAFALAAAGCLGRNSNDGYERADGYETTAPSAGYDQPNPYGDPYANPALADGGDLRTMGSTNPYDLDRAGGEYVGDGGRGEKQGRGWRFWRRRPKDAPPEHRPYEPAGAGGFSPESGGAGAPANYGGYGGVDYAAANAGYVPPAMGHAVNLPPVRGVNPAGLGIQFHDGDGAPVSPIASAAPTGQPFDPYHTAPANAATASYPTSNHAGAATNYPPLGSSGAPAPTPSGLVAANPVSPLPATFDAPRVPAPARPEMERARQLVRTGQYEGARAILEQEIARHADDADAWMWYGDCLYNMLQLKPAVDAYAKALTLNPTLYLAQRGQGFAYLHLGHEHWARQEAARRVRNVEAADAAFIDAHEAYRQALANLRQCAAVDPQDDEAAYGRAMAAEGFSRRLYAQARSWLRAADLASGAADAENARATARQFAANCEEIIRGDGLQMAQRRVAADPRDSGPRALQGGLYQRLAMLNHFMGKETQARENLRLAIDVQESILRDIAGDNPIARAAIAECKRYLDGQWPGVGVA